MILSATTSSGSWSLRFARTTSEKLPSPRCRSTSKSDIYTGCRVLEEVVTRVEELLRGTHLE